jgi:hypothetical protein
MKLTNDFNADSLVRYPTEVAQKAYVQGRLDQLSLMNSQYDDDGLEYRGYGLLPYNIKEVQAGIQYSHSIIEYVLEFFHTKAFQLWGKKHKTAILLDGGTSCHTPQHYSNTEYVGTMEKHYKYLKEIGVDFSTFYEPDMNNMLSGIFLIADERIFNFKKYPDYGTFYVETTDTIEKEQWWKPKMTPPQEWIDALGGDNVYKLREFLRRMPLWR